MNVRAVDIIIPVYNAPLELEECYNSLLKNTDLNCHRIIIINDCSPDPGVNKFLNKITDERVVILQNETNLGFVGTVNKGMDISNSDVVLLNSDTIVTKNWLKKMGEVAYSEDDIATVTPLTNNGTICSVPDFLDDNVLPEGYTIDTFAYLIEKISYKVFPAIPTAVGFCMYIKRSVLDEVGLFDMDNFGKGYGEENDFCCRVIECGYKNVLADDTFIYHKGSMSFQGEKLELSKRNLRVLNSLYPYYEKMIQEFILKNPLRSIQENIKLHLPLYKDINEESNNVLYIIHNFFDEVYNHPIGGTEYHLKDLVEKSTQINSFVLAANESELVLKQYNKGKYTGKYHFPLSTPLSSIHFHHREYSEIVEKIMGTFKINIVHIQHLIKHTFDVPRIAAKMKISVLCTLHDFYLFCPPQIVSIKSPYYNDTETNGKVVSKEFHQFYDSRKTYIQRRKKEVIKLISHIDQFIVPSGFAKDLFISEYPMLDGKIRVIEHGYSDRRRSVETSPEKKEGVWNVGFLGGISPVKGSDLVYKLIKKYSNPNINWHIIGGIGDQRINMLSQVNLYKHGEYKREELDEILDTLKLDIILCLSVVPETFSYTLSEAWQSGTPVLVTPVGALKERVEKVSGGWIAKSTKLDDVVTSFETIISSPNDWVMMRNHLNQQKFKSTVEMVNEYEAIYSKWINLPSKDAEVFDIHEVNKALKYFLPKSSEDNVNYYNQLHKLEAELRAIKGTIGWKVLEKLRMRNSIVLVIGKKMIYYVLRLNNKFKG
ncbi:glycosyltransferase [Paenibacillus sp. CAU 1782]